MRSKLRLIGTVFIGISTWATALLAASVEPWKFVELAVGSPQHSKPDTLDRFKDSQLLLTFWRSDCPPCSPQPQVLLDIAIDNPKLQVALISLQDDVTTRKWMPKHLPRNMHILVTLDDAGKVLASYAKKNPTLPFSAFLRSDGSICERQFGTVGMKLISKWMESCAEQKTEGKSGENPKEGPEPKPEEKAEPDAAVAKEK